MPRSSPCGLRLKMPKVSSARSLCLKMLLVQRPRCCLFGTSSTKIWRDFLEVPMHRRIAANDGDNAGITLQAAHGEAEVVRRHVPERILIFQKARAVRAGEIAFVCDVDADNLHLIGAAHLRNRLIAKKFVQRAISLFNAAWLLIQSVPDHAKSMDIFQRPGKPVDGIYIPAQEEGGYYHGAITGETKLRR